MPSMPWYLWLIDSFLLLCTNGKSLLKIVFGQSPYYTILRTCDCCCYTITPKAQRLVLDCSATRCCFVVYASQYTMVICVSICLITSSILVSRNVLFDESSYPLHQKDLSTSTCWFEIWDYRGRLVFLYFWDKCELSTKKL